MYWHVVTLSLLSESILRCQNSTKVLVEHNIYSVKSLLTNPRSNHVSLLLCFPYASTNSLCYTTTRPQHITKIIEIIHHFHDITTMYEIRIFLYLSMFFQTSYAYKYIWTDTRLNILGTFNERWCSCIWYCALDTVLNYLFLSQTPQWLTFATVT